MRRFSKISGIEPTPLDAGIDPPEGPIYDYDKEKDDPVISLCKKCGKSHGMGIKNTKTGEFTPMDVCYDCLWLEILKALEA